MMLSVAIFSQTLESSLSAKEDIIFHRVEHFKCDFVEFHFKGCFLNKAELSQLQPTLIVAQGGEDLFRSGFVKVKKYNTLLKYIMPLSPF